MEKIYLMEKKKWVYIFLHDEKNDILEKPSAIAAFTTCARL